LRLNMAPVLEVGKPFCVIQKKTFIFIPGGYLSNTLRVSHEINATNFYTRSSSTFKVGWVLEVRTSWVCTYF
jgi:hypothetical protein